MNRAASDQLREEFGITEEATDLDPFSVTPDEVRALQAALRLSTEQFAKRLGIGVSILREWKRRTRDSIRPRNGRAQLLALLTRARELGLVPPARARAARPQHPNAGSTPLVRWRCTQCGARVKANDRRAHGDGNYVHALPPGGDVQGYCGPLQIEDRREKKPTEGER